MLCWLEHLKFRHSDIGRARNPEKEPTVEQINLHRCEGASNNLLTTLHRPEVELALIQAPWSLNDRIPGLNKLDYRLLVSVY